MPGVKNSFERAHNDNYCVYYEAQTTHDEEQPTHDDVVCLFRTVLNMRKVLLLLFLLNMKQLQAVSVAVGDCTTKTANSILNA